MTYRNRTARREVPHWLTVRVTSVRRFHCHARKTGLPDPGGRVWGRERGCRRRALRRPVRDLGTSAAAWKLKAAGEISSRPCSCLPDGRSLKAATPAQFLQERRRLAPVDADGGRAKIVGEETFGSGPLLHWDAGVGQLNAEAHRLLMPLDFLLLHELAHQNTEIP